MEIKKQVQRLNPLSTFEECVSGHKHSDAARTVSALTSTEWVCLTCGKVFADFEALQKASY